MASAALTIRIADAKSFRLFIFELKQAIAAADGHDCPLTDRLEKAITRMERDMLPEEDER